MIMSGSRPFLTAIGAKFQSLIRFQIFFGLIVVLLTSVAATSPEDDNPDAQYIHIMSLIGRADALRASGKTDAAKVKYKEAQADLNNFKRNNPLWYPKTVTYRLNEVNDRLEVKPVIPEAAAPVKKTETKLESETASTAPKSSVKVLDAGLDPRKQLRLHLKAGDKQAVVFTVKVSLDMGASPAAAMMPKIPPVTIPADLTIEKVAANGDASYQVLLGEGSLAEEPGAASPMAAQAKMAFASIKGLSIAGVISTRGVNKNISIKAPPGADPKMTEALSKKVKEGIPASGSPLFPEEAVGPGAKWEIKTPAKAEGMTMDQTATVELVSLQGDLLNCTLTMSGNSNIDDQPMEKPAGSTPSPVSKINFNGTGNATSDLSRLFPSKASLDLHMDMAANLPGGDPKQPMSMKMDLTLGIEAK